MGKDLIVDPELRLGGHVMDYNDLEDAVESYLKNSVKAMLDDCWIVPETERGVPELVFNSHMDCNEVGIKIDLRETINTIVDSIEQDLPDECDWEYARFWHDFFTESAKRLEPYIEERSDA
jgi:hypothetical protein